MMLKQRVPRWAELGLVAGLALAASEGWADPVNKNFSGAFVTGGASFGQAYIAGNAKPGLAWFASATPGYIIARDTWNRFELGVELGTGSLEYRQKTGAKAKLETPITVFALAKVGYGYSLGDHAFAVWQIGVGPAMADATYKVGGASYEATDAITGFMGQVGLDIVFPGGENLDLVGGFNFRFVNLSIDEVEGPTGKANVDETMQVNVPVLHIGARYRL